MKILLKTFKENAFFRINEARFVYKNDPAPRARKQEIDRRLDRSNKREGKAKGNLTVIQEKVESLEQKRQSRKSEREEMLSNLSTGQEGLIPKLDEYIKEQEEYSAISSMKGSQIYNRHKKTVREAKKNSKAEKVKKYNEYLGIVEGLAPKIREQNDAAKERLKKSEYALQKLQEHQRASLGKYEILKQFPVMYSNGSIPSKRLRGKFKTTKKEAIDEANKFLIELETIKESIENTQKDIEEETKFVLETDTILSFLRTRKDAYSKHKFSEKDLTLKIIKTIRAFFAKNVRTSTDYDVRGLMSKNYKSLEDVSKTVRSLKEEATLTQKKIDLKTAQKSLNDWNNYPVQLQDEAWEKKQKDLQKDVDEAQTALDKSEDKASERAADILDTKNKDLDEKQKEVDDKKQSALKKIDELIKQKKHYGRLNYLHDPDIMEEITLLETQRSNIENQEFLDNLPEGDAFEAYKKTIDEATSIENYISSFQTELSSLGISYDNSKLSLHSSENYSCSVDIKPAAKSRIEREVQEEIETNFSAEIKELESLSVQYGQKKVEVEILKTKYKNAEAQNGVCTPGDIACQKKVDTLLKGFRDNLNAAVSEKEEIEQSIKDTISALEKKQAKTNSDNLNKVLDLTLIKSNLDLDPKSKESDKIEASKNLKEAEVSQELMSKILESKINAASQGLPREREKLKYEHCIERALKKIDIKGSNYQRLKDVNRELNLLEYDVRDAATLEEEESFLQKISEYEEEYNQLTFDLEKDMQEVLQNLRADKNGLEKAYQEAVDSDEASTESGRLKIKFAKQDLDEMDRQMEVVEQAFADEFYSLTGSKLQFTGFEEAGRDFYSFSSPPKFSRFLDVDGSRRECYRRRIRPGAYLSRSLYKKYYEELNNPNDIPESPGSEMEGIDYKSISTPKQKESSDYMPENFAERIIDTDQWSKYPVSVQKLIVENRNMMTPVHETKNGVSLAKYGNVVEIVPVNFKTVPFEEYSPRYYEVKDNGKLVFIDEFKVDNGEKFGFQREYTPKTMQERINGLEGVFENIQDYKNGEKYMTKMEKEWSELETGGDFKIVKGWTTLGRKFRLKFSPSNNSESELFNQDCYADYDPVKKTWKIDMSGLSTVEKEELEREGITSKTMSRGEFNEKIRDFSKKSRENYVDESPSFSTVMSNWWANLSLNNPASWIGLG